MTKYLRYIGNSPSFVEGGIYTVEAERPNTFNGKITMYKLRDLDRIGEYPSYDFIVVSCPCSIKGCLTHRKPT